MNSVGIYSMNARGLKDKAKRTQVFSWLHNKNANVYFLQETHSSLQLEDEWTENWGNDAIYFSHGTSNSKGVCILFKDASQVTINKQYHDDKGRLLILDILIANQKITLVNVYGPNVDDSAFFSYVMEQISHFDCESIIWGGDFNCVLDIYMDKKGGRSTTHRNSVATINEIMDEFNLIDVWRFKNPKLCKYTWHSRNIFCRLDFFLITNNLVAQVNKCTISPGFKTDHSALSLNLTLVNETRGRGFWKFNTSLLQDDIYAELIRNCIQQNKSTYFDTLDPNTFWDFLKCQMRSVTIQYSIKKSKESRLLEANLVKRLDHLQSEYTTNPSASVLEQIKLCKDELDLLYEKKTNGVIVRSRANWFENGEKNTKFFINLEKRNQKQKLITNIYNDNGDLVSSTKEILNTAKDYFKSIYTSCNPPQTNFGNLLPGDSENVKLSLNEQEKCEGLITINECLESLKTMKNNKSPGTDGFPSEFYKHFF